MGKLTKIHKLYFREDKNENLRNLAKASPKIYSRIIDFFLNEGGNLEYEKKNKDVTSISKLTPLTLIITEEYLQEFKKLTKEKELVVTYNGSWRPLVKLQQK